MHFDALQYYVEWYLKENWSFSELGNLSERKVPACFKDALVSPIPKRANPTETSPFRPISLLPLLSKILEKTVAKYWIRPNISITLRKDQCAYVPEPVKWTTSALTLVNHLVLQFLDSESGAVRVLSTDFTKAFEKLPHQVKIDSSYHLRLPLQAIEWIKSFLSGRDNAFESVHNCLTGPVSLLARHRATL